MSNSHTPVPQPTSKNGGTLQDNAGTVVCVGDVVAFNYSGEIAVGTVTAIKTMPPVSNSGVFYGWERYRNVITIQRVKPDAGISRVSSVKNLLVIVEGPQHEQM